MGTERGSWRSRDDRERQGSGHRSRISASTLRQCSRPPDLQRRIIGESAILLSGLVAMDSSTVGQRFGRLIAIEAISRYEWAFKCDCGSIKIVLLSNVRNGRTRSCGCLRRELASVNNTTHGAPRTRQTWKNMIMRCRDPDARWYGAKGVTVCEQWMVFENFLADMGPCPPGFTIDRYPNFDGNYEPGNCRWASPTEQNENRRCSNCREKGHYAITCPIIELKG